MCLLRVKEEQYNSEPVRVKHVRQVRRSYTPPAVQTARYSNTKVVEEQRSSTYDIPPPAPAPSNPSVHYSSTKETRRTSRVPSVHQSVTVIEPIQSRDTPYVEVIHDAASESSRSYSPPEDVRSQSTRRTSNPPKSTTTRRSSASKTTAPASMYSEHEKEIRRERIYSSGRPSGDYEARRYGDAPMEYGRRRDYDGRRMSRESYGHRSSRVTIEDERSRRQREYLR